MRPLRSELAALLNDHPYATCKSTYLAEHRVVLGALLFHFSTSGQNSRRAALHNTADHSTQLVYLEILRVVETIIPEPEQWRVTCYAFAGNPELRRSYGCEIT